jgi:beta-lactamase regulating signal transducer with metallopeptidase domain
MRKYSQKGLERRKEERQCLPEFYKKHIEIAKTKHCENCGQKLD